MIVQFFGSSVDAFSYEREKKKGLELLD